MAYDPENVTLYPVDSEAVDMNFLEAEELYELNADKHVLKGEINPRFVRWYEEDNSNPEPMDDSQAMKVRYRTCKLCPQFDQELLKCDLCECFMPIKVQFKSNSCPDGKWDAITE